MNVGDRIKVLRRALNLTQQDFADRIGVKRNTIGTYEIGRNAPIDAVISLICREFGVSEAWLRTGEGEMFAARSREDELSAAVNSILSGEDAEFRRRLILLLSRLNTDQWDRLQQYAWELVEGLPTSAGDRSAPQPPAEPDRRDWRDKDPSEWDDEDEATAVEEFRRQWRDEKNRRTEDGPVGGASAG